MLEAIHGIYGPLVALLLWPLLQTLYGIGALLRWIGNGLCSGATAALQWVENNLLGA